MSKSWDIPIVHQEANWLVIDKPAGLSVHNAEDPDNVLSVLSRHAPDKLYPVHRLDKPTSGLLVLAYQPAMVTELQRALQRATKVYWAIVRGVPAPEEGSWRQTISDKAEGRNNPRGKKRVEAQTDYQVISSNQHLAKIECTIMTGRQHQIRKHCAINRHEILGDTRYGDRRYQQKMTQRFGELSLCLQAKSLRITVHDKEMFFEVPPAQEWSRLGDL